MANSNNEREKREETTVQFDKLTLVRAFESLTLKNVWEEAGTVGLNPQNAYLTQNGRVLKKDDTPKSGTVHVHVRLRGGKGGFGSMLRAIGAQIEKTTNREACRDLSGRRLKDINEEKRLREWLEKQNAEPEDPSEKFQKKIAKLLAKPKHEFKDEVYDKQRADLTANMDDAVEQGFKMMQERGLKRAAEESKKEIKKPKGAFWMGYEDSSDEEEDESDEEDFEDETMQSIIQLYLKEREKIIESEEKSEDESKTEPKKEEVMSKTPETQTAEAENPTTETSEEKTK